MNFARIVSYFRVPRLSYRVWKVWKRDQDVFMKTFKVNFIPPLVEPLLYIFGLGFGLGAFVQLPNANYTVFIAPALISVSMMYSSFFECTYASFVRMYYQKTFDAIIATPVSLEEVIAGELLWGATKSLINSTLVLVITLIFGLVNISPPLFLLVLPMSFLVGLLFSAVAMCFTAITPNIDSFNYPAFLFITPMFILSGTFFPITNSTIQTVAGIFFPLFHAVAMTRALTTLTLSWSLLLNLAWFLITTPFFFVLSINLMKRRLVK